MYVGKAGIFMPKNRLSSIRSAFSYLFRFIAPHKKWYIAASGAAVLLVGVSLLQAKVTASLVDVSATGKINPILYALCLFLVVLLLKIAFTYICGISSSKLAAKVSRDLKRHVCAQLIHAEYGAVSGIKSGDTLSTVNTDTAAVCDFIAGDFISLFSQIIMAVGAFSFLLAVNPRLCLISFVYTPLGMFFTLSLNKKMNALYPLVADLKGEALSAAEQALSCIPVIKSFLMERQVRNRVHAQFEHIRRTEMNISVWNALLQPACSTTSFIPQFIYLLYGGYAVMRGALSLGMYIAVYDLINFVIAPTVYFPFMLNSFNATVASINRIRRIESLPQEIPAQKSTVSACPSVTIENLSFSYGESGAAVLRDLSFSHCGAGLIAVCGESGCGKTTLFDLIAGLYSPHNGNIRVSGKIGVLPQDAELFAATAMENIRLGDERFTDADVIAAATAAGADDFIRAMPDGYDAQLGDGRANLSGGQKQRIALARLLLRDAAVWLLDEPTSALDAQTEHLILEVIRQKSKEKLIIASAHRHSMIRFADRVIELKGGMAQ